MRLVKVLLMAGLLVLSGLIVQENAARTAGMTVFGKTVFEGVSVPVLILLSLLSGMLLMLPFLARARWRGRKNNPRKPSGDKDGDP